MSLSKIFILFLSFFLQACLWGNDSKTLNPADSIPSAFILEDHEGNTIGKAIPFENNIYVTPDHLWQEAGKLYLEQKPIDVLVRDFQHDVLFFTLKQKQLSSTIWREQPPSLDQELFWFDGFQMHETSVSGTNESFFSEDIIIDLMSIKGKLEPGDSGAPLFDEEGRIYGMLIGTDLEKNKSYFVRSDVIQDLAQEYLEKN